MAVEHVAVAGGRLAYERAGAGPPLVLLHGRGIDRAVWAGVADHLLGAFDTIRLDLRGHGESSPWDGPYAHHEDVARALDGLGIAEAHVAGLSLGGAVAIDLARAHAARVRTLTLVAAALPGHAWSAEWREAQRALFALGAAEGAEAARAGWGAHPLFASAPRPFVDEMVARDSGRRWVERDPWRPLEPLAATHLDEIHAPTLVVVGASDLPDFRAIAHELARGIAAVRLIILDGVGHLPPIEAPERVAELIAQHARA